MLEFDKSLCKRPSTQVDEPQDAASGSNYSGFGTLRSSNIASSLCALLWILFAKLKYVCFAMLAIEDHISGARSQAA